jgi:hypothetical protein
MAGIARFEDIQAWQEARKLVKMVYTMTAQGALSKDLLARQTDGMLFDHKERSR